MTKRFELPAEKWVDAMTDACDQARPGDTIVVHSFAQRKTVLDRLGPDSGVSIKWEDAQLVRFQAGEMGDPRTLARNIYRMITGKEAQDD